MEKKKNNLTTPVDTVKHMDKRVNIPTEDLRDFVKEDETKPKTILYPATRRLTRSLCGRGKTNCICKSYQELEEFFDSVQRFTLLKDFFLLEQQLPPARRRKTNA